MVLTGNSTVPRTIGALDRLDAGSVRLPIFVLLTCAHRNESRIIESGLGPHGRRLGTSWLGLLAYGLGLGCVTVDASLKVTNHILLGHNRDAYRASWLGGESGSFFLGVSWSGIQGLELLLGA